MPFSFFFFYKLAPSFLTEWPYFFDTFHFDVRDIKELQTMCSGEIWTENVPQEKQSDRSAV